MDELALYAELRELIGNPTPTEVSNRQLRAYLVPALEWLAGELKYSVTQDDTAVSLVAGQQEYPLPSDVIWILWGHWHNLRLDARSPYFWDREGTTWRGAPQADVLTEYAVVGRSVVLVAPPSALCVTTDPALHLRYVLAPPMIEGAGVISLSELDTYIALLRAALRYCRSHPSEENTARAANYVEELKEHLPQAKRRALSYIAHETPSLQPYSERTGGARKFVRIRRPVLTKIRYHTVKEDLDCGPI